MSEPNIVYGRVLEAAHLSGYSVTRLFDELEWLLAEDRWKQVGDGHESINGFLATIDLSPFNLTAPKRKQLARKLAELEASQRSTAAALGVAHTTVHRDLGTNVPPADAEPAVQAKPKDGAGTNVPPAPASAQGSNVAEIAKKQSEKQAARSERERNRAADRAQAEEEARSAGLRCDLEVADLRTWRPEGVDAIVTDPPYITDDATDLYAALADFAVDVLPNGGTLIAMTSQKILPAVIRAMSRPGLSYRWTISWAYETNERTPEHQPRVFDGWKPVLVFHKGQMPADATFIYDVIRSDNLDKASHEWGQSIPGFRSLVRAASEPGQTICDPFLGGGTTAVAALAEARGFVGCDVDAAAVQTTAKRLAA